jgi:RNA 3'-terminal phosphate cyclase
MSISNDHDFKTALGALDLARQRQVAARMVQNVLGLTGDPRVKAAVAAAKRADISGPELDVAYAAAKTASVESYTHCGQEGDWMGQAGHFAAEAAMNCVAPAAKSETLAWNAAMSARMARMCESIAVGHGTENREAEAQYRILEAFLEQ